MKRYKLLKDLPTVKAGATFREIVREVDGSRVLKEYGINNKVSILVSEINNFDEWFEEIQEPTDSIHWKPQPGDTYWFVDCWGVVNRTEWDDTIADAYNFDSENVYRTEEECKKARTRKLAEVRLRRTSTFKPDFYNGMFAYTVGYDCKHKRLYVTKLVDVIIGNPITYESLEDAEKSIEGHKEDWLIYFGIREEK